MNNLIEILNLGGEKFVEFALPMLIQSSVLIGILLGIDLLLRKKVRATFRYWLWMLVLVKLVLPPTFSSPVSFGQIFGDRMDTALISNEPSGNASVSLARAPDSGAAFSAINPTVETSGTIEIEQQQEAGISESVLSESESLDWQAIILVVWFGAAAAMLLLVIQRVFFVMGLIRQAQPAQGLLTDTLEFCRKKMGVKLPIKLRISANATSPAVCGLFRPVILVPQDLAPSLGAGHLRVVLMHELGHIKRGDLWVNLVQTALQIIYFYNPLLWVANAIIRRIREQAVDEMVQVAMAEKAADYPETLLNVAKLAFGRPALALRFIGVVESKSQLKGRIKKMLNQPIPKTAKLGIAGLAAIIIIAALLLPMAAAQKSEAAESIEKRSQKVEDSRQKTELQVIEGKELNLSIAIPADWSCYKSPAPGRYKFSWQLLPSKLKAWAMFIGSEFPQDELAANIPVRQIAVGDVAILKSYFNKYTVRADSWTEYWISEMPAVNYVADYVDEGSAMVEYRSYILSKSMVYWFVFRIEKDKFDSNKEQFDSIANSFKLSGGNKTDVQIEVENDQSVDEEDSQAIAKESDSVDIMTSLARAHYKTLTQAYDKKDWPVVDEAANELSDVVRDYLDEHKELQTTDRETYKLLHTLSEISDDLHDAVRDEKTYYIEPVYKVLQEVWGKFDKPTPRRSPGAGKKTELSNDDGKDAGKWSFSGGGHGVKFRAPSDKCVLKAVKLYGSRYGEYEAPDEDFDVWLCDKDFNVIVNFKFPYSLFKKRGYAKWVTLKVDDVEVPKDFAICVAFDPHQTKGIYVYHDAKGSRLSYQGIPPEMEPFKDGDWMIRAVVEDDSAKPGAGQNPVGEWQTVDFVRQIDDFNPEQRKWSEDFAFTSLRFNRDGSTSGPWTWKTGSLYHSRDRTTAKYVIKKIGDEQFLFMELISGDVTIRGQKPWYYVLRKD